MFDIATDLVKARVTFRVVGSLQPDEAAKLAEEIRKAALKTKGACGSFDILADMSAAQVMAQESSKFGKGIITWCFAAGIRKFATLTVAALMSMQAKRLVPFPNHRVFVSREDALAWLDASD
jgi:hypothetical protein